MKSVEIWKLVEEYPLAQIEVSNLGRIRKAGEIFEPKPNNSGYPYMHIPAPYSRQELIHVMICRTFNGPKPFPKALALHKDDVKSNMRSDNLYWGTHKNNRRDRAINRALNPRPVKTHWDIREERLRKEREARNLEEAKLIPDILKNIKNPWSK